MSEVVIIGAGASGMMTAIETRKNNKNTHITILEHNLVPGKKILATGNGRCNLTNRYISIDCFRSHDMDRVKELLTVTNADDVIERFSELGMLCTDKNGYIYPYSCQASTVNDILIKACECNDIDIVTDTHVLDIEVESDGRFVVKTSQGYVDNNGDRRKRKAIYAADKVVLACGGRAYPKLGSDGSGYNIAKNLGLKTIHVVPALTGLKCREKIYELAAGVRTQAIVKLYVDHEYVAEDKGELQLTDYGISGIPVFQISRYASYGISDGCKVHGIIDFMPDYTEDEISKILEQYIRMQDHTDIYTVLSGMLNSRLARMLLAYCRIQEEVCAKQFSKDNVDKLIDAIKGFYTVIVGTNDYEQSQVCAGGVKLSEVDNTFQTINIPGLYVTGEILDVDGICGGYNLHWAWMSAMVVGKNI